MMILYHGSDHIVSHPEICPSIRGLDFGAGFYMTTDEGQARRFSKSVYARGNRDREARSVAVFVFEENTAQTALGILKYESADADWLDYVVRNRMMEEMVAEGYDLVIGAVANDDVMPVIQALMSGFLTREAALVALKTKALKDQYCFKTVKALGFLRFMSGYEVAE